MAVSASPVSAGASIVAAFTCRLFHVKHGHQSKGQPLARLLLACFGLGRHAVGARGEDIDGPLAFVHLAAEGLPRLIAGDAGRIGPLTENQEDIGIRILVKVGDGREIVLEIGAALDRLDAGFQLLHKRRRTCFLFRLPVGALLRGDASLRHGDPPVAPPV